MKRALLDVASSYSEDLLIHKNLLLFKADGERIHSLIHKSFNTWNFVINAVFRVIWISLAINTFHAGLSNSVS